MQKINNIIELEMIISRYDKWVVYGAGYVGEMVYLVVDNLGLSGNISSFAVSKKPCNDSFMNKPIGAFDKSDNRVIVTVYENKQEEIIENIRKVNGECEIFLVTDLLISEIRIISNAQKRVRNITIEKTNEEWTRYVKHTIPIQQLKFTILLSEHCNLNCAHCNVFSPLRSEKYVDEKTLEMDLKRLSELSDKDAYAITLAGGEPLLNPRAIDIAIMVRCYFPKARIHFVTNGLLLMKQSERFFDECNKNDIEIEISEYPMNFNYDELKDFLKKKGVCYRTFATRPYMNKESFVLRPQDNGSQGSVNWFRCYRVNDCIRLNKGRLFCGKAEDIDVLKEKFPEQTKYIYTSPRDFIDIYKVDNIQEIFNFFSRPFPFCRHCDVSRWNEKYEWHISGRNANEWI